MSRAGFEPALRGGSNYVGILSQDSALAWLGLGLGYFRAVPTGPQDEGSRAERPAASESRTPGRRVR